MTYNENFQLTAKKIITIDSSSSTTKGYKIQEIYCPARYDNLSSSIKILRSAKYGCQVVYYTIKQILKGK